MPEAGDSAAADVEQVWRNPRPMAAMTRRGCRLTATSRPLAPIC